MHNAMWLKDVLVYLVAAGILIPLFHRARVSAVVGFIALGALLGPHGLGQWAGQVPALSYLTITDQHRAAQFGELGVIFLLFLLGLEFSAQKLWALRREVFGLGLLQVVFSGALLAAGLAMCGLSTDLALVTGVALAMSSTALVMQILVSERRATAPIGKTALAILLFQDLAVVAVLLAAELIGGPVQNLALVVGLALLKGVAAVGLILLAGRFVLGPLVGAAARTGARDLLMAVTLVVVAGTAGLTQAAGLSAALGAFLSGMLLSGTVYQHQISVDLEPFKGLLIGVFFVSVGMGVDLSAILPVLHWVLVAAAGVILAKFAATYGAARLLKVEAPLAGELGLLLSQTGEFAFVVIGLLQAKGVLEGQAAGFIVAVVTLTLVLTPWLAQAGGAVRVRLERALQDAQVFSVPEGGACGDRRIRSGRADRGREPGGPKRALRGAGCRCGAGAAGAGCGAPGVPGRCQPRGDPRPRGAGAGERGGRHLGRGPCRRGHGARRASPQAGRGGAGPGEGCRPCPAAGGVGRARRDPGSGGGEPASGRPCPAQSRPVRGGGDDPSGRGPRPRARPPHRGWLNRQSPVVAGGLS